MTAAIGLDEGHTDDLILFGGPFKDLVSKQAHPKVLGAGTLV